MKDMVETEEGDEDEEVEATGEEEVVNHNSLDKTGREMQPQ